MMVQARVRLQGEIRKGGVVKGGLLCLGLDHGPDNPTNGDMVRWEERLDGDTEV